MKLYVIALVGLLCIVPGSAIGQETVRIGNSVFMIGGKSKQQPLVSLDYARAYRDAVAQRRPLVVFVTMTGRQILGAVCCQVYSLQGYDGPCIVVSVPVGNELYWRQTLAFDATDLQVWHTFNYPMQPPDQREVQPMAQTFRRQQTATAACRT